MLCLALLWGTTASTGHAQGLQTSIDELAAFRTLAQTVQSGYHLTTTGLTSIGAAKDAEYQLHEAFFGQLATVSPAVAGDPELGALINRLQTLIQELNTQLNYWRQQSPIIQR